MNLRRLLLPSPREATRETTHVLMKDADGFLNIAKGAFAMPEAGQDDTNPKRAFAEAMRSAGLGWSDLPNLERDAGRKLEFYLVLTTAAALWLAVSIMLGLNGLRVVDLVLPVALMVLLGVKAWAASVRLYRIERRSMVPVRTWWQDRKGWLGKPPTSAMGVMLAVGTGTCLSLLFPAPALAQGAAAATAQGMQQVGNSMAWLTTTLGTDDLSAEWLRRLFPAAASLLCVGSGCPSPTTGDPLAAMFGVFNSILCGAGAAMLSYHTVMGTISTAQSGKVLGERWNTLYAPMRVASGFCSLVPIKGYCLAQLVVLKVILMGYGMANGLWVTYTAQVLSGDSASVAASQNPLMGLRLAHSVLASETCASALDLYRRQVEGNNRSMNPLRWNWSLLDAGVPGSTLPAAAGTQDADSGDKVWSWGTVCGTVRSAAGSVPANVPGSVLGSLTAGNGPVQGYRESTATNQAYANFITKRDEAVGKLITAVRDSGLPTLIREATATGSGGPTSAEVAQQLPTKYAAVKAAAVAFDAAVDAAAQDMLKTLNAGGATEFQARAAALGWASAGSMNAALVRASARAQELVAAAAPSSSGPDLERVGSGGVATEAGGRVRRALRAVQEVARDLGPAEAANRPQSVAIGADMQGRNIMAQVLQPVQSRLARLLTDNLGYIDPVRPMASIQTTGQVLLLSGEGVALTYIGLRAGAEGIAGQQVAAFLGSAAAKGALEAAGPYVTTISFALLGMGIMHSYVVPMMQFVLWFYAVFAVVTLAVELVVAAPLAALLHVRMDGQELINQEQRTIYVMAFQAFLRPSLLLFGLVGSNMVFAVMAGFLNRTYGMALSTTNGDTIIGIFGFISLTALIIYLHYQLAIRSMQLVSAVPSAVAELLGAKDQSRGEQDHTTHALATVTTGVRGAAGSAATSSIRNIERKPGPKPVGLGGDRPSVSPRPATGGTTAS